MILYWLNRQRNQICKLADTVTKCNVTRICAFSVHVTHQSPGLSSDYEELLSMKQCHNFSGDQKFAVTTNKTLSEKTAFFNVFTIDSHGQV